MSQLTPEYMKEWEGKLTKQQMNYAMILAYENGWITENPPMWVWAQIFRQAQEKYPSQPSKSKLTIVKALPEPESGIQRG